MILKWLKKKLGKRREKVEEVLVWEPPLASEIVETFELGRRPGKSLSDASEFAAGLFDKSHEQQGNFLPDTNSPPLAPGELTDFFDLPKEKPEEGD